MLVAHEFEGVTQIKMSRRADSTSVSAYLVDGLLVDTGLAYTADELLEFLMKQNVKTVVNTHYHEDHIGADHLLQEKLNLPVFAHPLSVEKINQRPDLYPYQEEVWGYPVPALVTAIGEYVLTDSCRFEVIPTPGHSPDHICLFERNKGWLFTGDLFHSKHPRVARPEEDQRQIIKSLHHVRELNARMLFTAPSNVVTESSKVLDETIRYLEELEQKIEALRQRGLSAREISHSIFGEEGPITAMTQGQFSSLNLVRGFGR